MRLSISDSLWKRGLDGTGVLGGSFREVFAIDCHLRWEGREKGDCPLGRLGYLCAFSFFLSFFLFFFLFFSSWLARIRIFPAYELLGSWYSYYLVLCK